jgi:hypothetical protein
MAETTTAKKKKEYDKEEDLLKEFPDGIKKKGYRARILGVEKKVQVDVREYLDNVMINGKPVTTFTKKGIRLLNDDEIRAMRDICDEALRWYAKPPDDDDVNP